MNLTIILCARDAASTIERAIVSVLPEVDCRLLLVDDGCRDATVAIARQAAGDRLRVVAVPAPGGIPRARQMGLEVCETEYAAWLDADDAWVPGRAARILAALGGGADVFCESIDLVDGASGRSLRRLDVPSFVRRERNPARLFERNHLPGDTQVGFRVATLRAAGGYDPEVYGVESFDLLLRVIARGAVFAYGDDVGYRMYAYSGSVSRHLARQRASLAAALKKHEYARVRAWCRAAGEADRVAAWVLVSMALFREEPGAALRFLEEASPAAADPREILEPDGPWPFREGWRRAFQRGTCLALLGGRDEEAIVELRAARSLEVTAEGDNNLGVVFARAGRAEEARGCWEQALQRFPGYLDARMNLEDPGAGRITTHPLRRQASRSEY
ncbi:MAG: glycosyltransferase family 2 protein [Opitutaceae bacterium]|nr:glycosyltransferase family 2 protein [Opitutaceae bacterium]